jgi:hypothetical protein
MLTKSSAPRLESRGPPAGTRSRRVRSYARVRSLAPRTRRGGDTDALDWRSDPRLLAILARLAQRERAAREKDQLPWRRDELDQQARRRRDRAGFRPVRGS